MGFTKTHDERLDGVLEYIDKYFAGSKALFEQRIAGLGAQKGAISNGCRSAREIRTRVQPRPSVVTVFEPCCF